MCVFCRMPELRVLQQEKKITVSIINQIITNNTLSVLILGASPPPHLSLSICFSIVQNNIMKILHIVDNKNAFTYIIYKEITNSIRETNLTKTM